MQYGLQKDWHFEKVISLKGAKLVNEVFQTLHGVGKECLNDSFKNVHLKTKGQRLKKLSLSLSQSFRQNQHCAQMRFLGQVSRSQTIQKKPDIPELDSCFCKILIEQLLRILGSKGP